MFGIVKCLSRGAWPVNTVTKDGHTASQGSAQIEGNSNSTASSSVESTDGEHEYGENAFSSLRCEESIADKRRKGNMESQLRIATDELDRVRRELLDCRQELAQTKVAKSDFLDNVGHELLTPMNGIVGITDLLLGGDLPPREMRSAKSIQSFTESLLMVVNNLLDFSEIESGSLKLQKIRFSVRDCVEDVCSSLAGHADEKNIELMCYVDENVPNRMTGDPQRIHQILNNLVTNAIDSTEAGEVVVRLSRAEEDVGSSSYQCEVQDSGAGMTPEMQAQLFTAFSQQDSSIYRFHGAMGIGLAVTKELVSLMGGEINFKSRMGEGTRFTFSINLHEVSDESVLASLPRTQVEPSIKKSLKGAAVTSISALTSEKEISRDASCADAKINIDAITSIRAMQRPGKDDLLKKIVGAFCTQTPVVIDQMQRAAIDNDAAQLVAGAHGLGASSAYLGADKMSLLCRHIETVVAGRDSDDLNQLVSSLKQEFELVSEQLNTIVKVA